MDCILNGQLIPLDQARVPVTDRGFLYGDSLFETARVYAGRALFLDHHLERMAAGIRLLGFSGSPGIADIRSSCERLLSANDVRDGVLRIALTRGSGPRGPNPSGVHSPTLLITTSPLPDGLEARATRGYRLVVSEWRKPSPRVLPNLAKTGNYLNSILAMQEAAARQADEALMLDGDGRIAECSHSNLFFIESGTLVTPSLDSGALRGIMRGFVLALAREAGIAVAERPVEYDALDGAQEIFVTNSVLGVMPVASVEDREFPVPGLVTAHLRDRWAERIRAKTAAEAVA